MKLIPLGPSHLLTSDDPSRAQHHLSVTPCNTVSMPARPGHRRAPSHEAKQARQTAAALMYEGERTRGRCGQEADALAAAVRNGQRRSQPASLESQV